MAEIIWTELAVSDLKDINEYISQDSPVYAKHFVKKLTSRVDQLQNFPKSGRKVPEFESDLIRN